MANPLATLLAMPASAPAVDLSVSERRQRWFEVGLVLWVACGGAFLNSLYLLKYGPGAMPSMSSARWAIGIVQEATALLLLGYVLSRRRLGLASLGLRWSFKDAGVGVLVAGASYAAYIIGAMFVQVVHYRLYGSFSHGPTGADFFAHPSILAIPFCLLNPFFEELIVRAHLMTEILQLTGSRALAVLVSVAVQFSYHLYYGWAGAISLSFLFLALALYYVRSRRALPIIVAHGLFDIAALVRLW
jgi:membrane protease YdiL (CAAX protease family)